MKVSRCLLITSIAAITAIGISAGARASVIGNDVNIDFAGSSTSFSFGGSADFTLYDSGDIFAPVDVSTSGTGQVNSLGAPFYSSPEPTVDFTNRGTVTYGSSDEYSSFPTETNIQYSNGYNYLGLAFSTPDGVYYGYAEFDNTTLLAYGYDTVAGQTITAGSAFTGSIPSSVPEPGSLLLLGSGLLAVGLTLIRCRKIS